MKNKKRMGYFVVFLLFLLILIILIFILVDRFNRPLDLYEKSYSDLTKEKGATAAISELKKAYSINPIVKSNCHQIIHAIGRAASKNYKSVGEAFMHGDSFCWSGYYHGVIEGFALNHNFNLKKDINNVCSNISGKERLSFDYYNCVHGLGHALMFVNGNEIFDSLNICDNLSGWWEQNSCYGGVFMENIISDNKYHFTKFLKSNDVLYPCNIVDTRYKNQCYLMQTSWILKVNKWDFEKGFDSCSKVDQGFVDICYQSLGRDASGYSKSDVTRTKKFCMMGKSFEQKSNCVIGAAKDFVAYFHSDEKAKEFCESLPQDLKETCVMTVNEFIKVL